ncbi:MAG: galactose-1-phosphate uridylyltransferase [Myxococcales bacterium]|nr:galactose-1-phosphate uridylyltransferase [Myxococcales bacterium]
MPELRQNLATGEWVIIADQRAKRPEEFRRPPNPRTAEVPDYTPTCPFCPGHEHQSEGLSQFPPEGPWLTRVVRNKFPALEPEGGPRVHRVHGVQRQMSGVGHHEVVIESPVHNQWPALQTTAQIQRVLQAFQDRGLALRHDGRVEQFVFFKNHGATAGTSLVHPHAQLIALPVVPTSHEQRIDSAWRYYDQHGECVHCRMLREELADGSRIVCENEHFVSFIPFAAFSPFHMWILPRQHRADFLQAPPEEVAALADVLRRAMRKLYFGLGDPDFNYVLHSAPVRRRAAGFLHWYLSLIPRVTQAAGFELGSGMYINTAVPEASARFLRGIEDPEGRPLGCHLPD